MTSIIIKNAFTFMNYYKWFYKQNVNIIFKGKY